jgi:hypothetical protein
MVFMHSVLSMVLSKDLKGFFIRPSISGDTRGFNSFSAVGKCAKGVQVHSPTTLNGFFLGGRRKNNFKVFFQ